MRRALGATAYVFTTVLTALLFSFDQCPAAYVDGATYTARFVVYLITLPIVTLPAVFVWRSR